MGRSTEASSTRIGLVGGSMEAFHGDATSTL